MWSGMRLHAVPQSSQAGPLPQLAAARVVHNQPFVIKFTGMWSHPHVACGRLLYMDMTSSNCVLYLPEVDTKFGALQVPGVYSDAYADAGLTYPSTSYLDDMAYAAAWMYCATKVSPPFTQDVESKSLCL